MPSSSQVLNDFYARSNQQTVKAAARIDKKKADIIADIEQEIPLSLVDISAKFGASYRTVKSALIRWGYNADELAKNINSRKIKNRTGVNFTAVKPLLAQKDTILARLEKEYPDRFIDICISLHTSPHRLKKVFLDNGLDLTPIIAAAKKRRGRDLSPKEHKRAVSLLNKKWV